MLETSLRGPVLLAEAAELDLYKTFECGQCFRWNCGDDGSWTGVARSRAATLRREGESVYIDSDDPLWSDYFDLETDYRALDRGFSGYSPYLDRCMEFGRGIRILRQDRWEALCSFIISQCNNIPRIKGIVERLCELAGEPFNYGGRTLYAFPAAERLASMEPKELDPIRSGYRAPYIIGAARAVAEGRLDLDALVLESAEEALSALLSLNGVGKKVANCALLFGLRHMEAFPVDVWMKRALKDNFPPGFDPAFLGPWAGLAQQYIFFAERSGGKNEKLRIPAVTLR